MKEPWPALRAVGELSHAHRRPGDVHLHFFGTATLSFADGIRVEPGETFEIDLPALGAPLLNPLAVAPRDFALDGVVAL